MDENNYFFVLTNVEQKGSVSLLEVPVTLSPALTIRVHVTSQLFQISCYMIVLSEVTDSWSGSSSLKKFSIQRGGQFGTRVS